MNRKSKLLVFVIGMMAGISAFAHDCRIFNAKLSGFNEVPAILTKGEGTFNSTLDVSGTMLFYTLTFAGLSANATAAHIHFGKPGTNGGAIAFLCGGGGKPACPIAGSMSGTIIAADVLAAANQGVDAGSFADFLRILRNDVAYVNVHSTKYPAGEIRGRVVSED